MKNPFFVVKDFLFAKNPPNHIKVPDSSTIVLIFRLIFEELLEFAIACGTGIAYKCVLEARKMLDNFIDKHKIDMDYEEHEEWIDADLVQVLDAFIDLEVVVKNGIVYFGMTSIAEEAYEEVMRANMTKISIPREKAEYQLSLVKEKYNDAEIEIKTTPFGTMYVSPNGKILKPINFKDPDLRQIISENLPNIGILTNETINALNIYAYFMYKGVRGAFKINRGVTFSDGSSGVYTTVDNNEILSPLMFNPFYDVIDGKIFIKDLLKGCSNE